MIPAQRASVVVILGWLVTAGFILACATATPTPFPKSQWDGRYMYRYEPPQRRPPASVRANVIVINPFYREPESTFSDTRYARVGRGMSASMGVDLDKIIVAKGMTTIGPYPTLDDVTFPDKRGADVTLAPRVFLTTDTKLGPAVPTTYDGVGYMSQPFTMKIGGWVAYEMREPLSAQKLWVKRLDLEDREVRGVDVFEAVAARKDNYGNVTQWTTGPLKLNGREDALATAIREYYPEIMGKAWTYLNTDEILDLKEKSKEIRERKVY